MQNLPDVHWNTLQTKGITVVLVVLPVVLTCFDEPLRVSRTHPSLTIGASNSASFSSASSASHSKTFFSICARPGDQVQLSTEPISLPDPRTHAGGSLNSSCLQGPWHENEDNANSNNLSQFMKISAYCMDLHG